MLKSHRCHFHCSVKKLKYPINGISYEKIHQHTEQQWKIQFVWDGEPLMPTNKLSTADFFFDQREKLYQIIRVWEYYRWCCCCHDNVGFFLLHVVFLWCINARIALLVFVHIYRISCTFSRPHRWVLFWWTS